MFVLEKAAHIRERIPYGLRFAAKQVLTLLTGLLLARTRLFEGLPSLAVAFTAAAPKSCLLTACAGSIAGSLLFSEDPLTGLMGAAAVLACGMISFSLRSITQTQETPLSAMAVSFLCCAASGVTITLANGFYPGSVLMFLCDGLLAGGVAYFYVRALALWKVLHRPAALDSAEALSLMAGICALLLSFSSVHIFIFVPSRILAVWLILLSAELFAETGGGAAGILCGTALEIACKTPGLACCYALGGLLGGLFARRKRWLLPLVLTCIAGLYPVLTQDTDAVAVFAETAFAGAVFCLVPQKALLRLRKLFSAASAPTDKNLVRVSNQLQTAARALSEITPYLTEQQLRQGKVPGTAFMTRRVQELSCMDCANRKSCWDTQERETRTALAECFSLLHSKQYLSPEELPGNLAEKCTRRNMLCASCIQAYEENAQSPYGRCAERTGTDPFAAASDLLTDAAARFADTRQLLQRESAAAAQVFRSFGVKVHNAACFSQNGRYTLYVTTEAMAADINKSALSAELGRACGCSFALPTISAAGEEFRWSFAQVEQLRLRTGTAQHAADGHTCGDFFLTFARDGKQYFILCDGMGTGASAAADAQATAEIFASLLRADLSFACALRTVNSALLMREDTESVSTLDVVCVDLYNGETHFYKAGAAASYLLRGKKMDCVETPCMPIGILPGARFEHEKRTLRKGDVIVMVSDGTCALRDDPIVDALKRFDGGSAQTLAESILRSSRKNLQKNKEDDSTVLAIVVE